MDMFLTEEHKIFCDQIRRSCWCLAQERQRKDIEKGTAQKVLERPRQISLLARNRFLKIPPLNKRI